MKKNLSFDEQIKNQLEHFEPVVPSHIWENIERDRDKKRSAIFWWNFLNGKQLLWLGIVVFSFIGIFFFWNWNQDNKISNTENQNNPSSTNTTIISSNKSNTDQPVISSEKNNVSNASNYQETNKNLSVSSAVDKNRIEGNGLPTSKKENNVAVFHPTESNSNAVAQEMSHHSKSIKSGGKHKMRVSKNSETAVLENNESNAVDSAYETIETALQANNADASLITSKLKFLPAIQPLNKKAIAIPCPVNNPNPAFNKKYLDIYSSADYVIRQFNDTPNSNYMQMRKQSTRFTSAFSFGLRYTKVFNNGLSIRFGANFSQINERFKYAQGNIIQLMYIINATGDTIGSYQSSSTRYKTTYNTYRTLDVPVSLGYETSKGRWNINYNAGIIVNAHSWNQGEVLDRTLTPVKIGTNDTQTPYQFKTNIGIGGLGAISFYYNMNDKIKLFAEPYFRYNFSTISKAELTLKQKYHTTGLKLGVRMDLK